MWPPAGDFEGALDGFLASDIGEIDFLVVWLVKDPGEIDARGRQLDFAFQERSGLPQILHGDHVHALDHRRFRRVLRRHQQAGSSFCPRLEGDGQHALDGADGAGQGEFADQHEIVELIGLNLIIGVQARRWRWADRSSAPPS